MKPIIFSVILQGTEVKDMKVVIGRPVTLADGSQVGKVISGMVMEDGSYEIECIVTDKEAIQMIDKSLKQYSDTSIMCVMPDAKGAGHKVIK